IGMWEHVLESLETQDYDAIGRQVDWAIKLALIERFRRREGLGLAHPRVALIDLAYHDVKRTRGLYHLLESKGVVENPLCDDDVQQATTEPPATTRARLRGEFVRAAKERHRDFTVDWVHLKLNDQPQRTVLCKDPFKAVDERVEKLIASL
ncbi:MAG: proteasome accessory factor PafA2 family protein, partial [Actinomycetota bacterium]